MQIRRLERIGQSVRIARVGNRVGNRKPGQQVGAISLTASPPRSTLDNVHPRRPSICRGAQCCTNAGTWQSYRPRTRSPVLPNSISIISIRPLVKNLRRNGGHSAPVLTRCIEPEPPPRPCRAMDRRPEGAWNGVNESPLLLGGVSRPDSTAARSRGRPASRLSRGWNLGWERGGIVGRRRPGLSNPGDFALRNTYFPVSCLRRSPLPWSDRNIEARGWRVTFCPLRDTHIVVSQHH
jgi:hypothetical protein